MVPLGCEKSLIHAPAFELPGAGVQDRGSDLALAILHEGETGMVTAFDSELGARHGANRRRLSLLEVEHRPWADGLDRESTICASHLYPGAGWTEGLTRDDE